MKLSIVIVTRERKKDLFECLDSIFKSPPDFSFEVVVVFNGPTSYMHECNERYPIKTLKLPLHFSPSGARNEAFQAITGEYTLFLDDDCVIPEEYFQKIFVNDEWDVLGGPDQSPPNSTSLQKDIGYCLSSPFCMGPTRKRHARTSVYLKSATERDLILCNLLFKSEIFQKEGFKFNNLLIRNEENFLIKELQSAHKVIHYNPDLYVYHKRKEDWDRLGKAIESSGYHRVINFYLRPTIKEVFYIAPFVFVLIMVLGLFFMPAFFATAEFIYNVCIIFYSLKEYKKINTNIILIHHFIIARYALGLLKGLFQFQMIFKENKSLMSESRIK